MPTDSLRDRLHELDFAAARRLLREGAEISVRGALRGISTGVSRRNPYTLRPDVGPYIRSTINLVKIILSRGADPNEKDGYGPSAVLTATRWASLPLLKLLIDHGADVNHRAHAFSPLTEAVYSMFDDIAALLVQRGAEPVVYRNQSVLLVAAYLGLIKTVRSALKIPTAVDIRGQIDEDLIWLLRLPRMSPEAEAQAEALRTKPTAYYGHATPVIVAAAAGHRSIVEVLVGAGADLACHEDSGLTALAAAQSRGHLELASWLRAQGAPEAAVRSASEIAFEAAESGDVDSVLKCLKEGVDVDSRDRRDKFKGRTLLMTAILADRPLVAASLIDHGADVDLRDLDDLGSVFQEMWTKLKDLKNGSDRIGMVALHYAAALGDVPTTERLVARGAEIDAIDGTRHTPLMIAAANDQARAARALVGAGADTKRKGFEKATAFRIALDCQAVRVVEYFLKEGIADANSRVGHDRPLTIALLFRNDDLAKTLAEAGADIELCDKERKSLLAEANFHADTLAAIEAARGSVVIPDPAAGSQAKTPKKRKRRGAKPEPIQDRGLSTQDMDQSLVLVHADVDAVTEATVSLAEKGKAAKDVHGKLVHATNECYIVYQLAGHRWTCIHPVSIAVAKSRFGPTMAKVLSKRLKTKTIYYENDDVVVYFGYEYFKNGKSMEYVYLGPRSCEAAFRRDRGPHDLGDDEEDIVKVRSRRRKIRKSDVEFDADFIHDFFVAEDAYVPPWSNRELRLLGKSKRYFSHMEKGAFARVDFVAF